MPSFKFVITVCLWNAKCHAKVSGLGHNNLLMSPMKDSWSLSQMSTRDGNYFFSRAPRTSDEKENGYKKTRMAIAELLAFHANAMISWRYHTDMCINFETKYLIDVSMIKSLFNCIYDGPFRGNSRRWG